MNNQCLSRFTNAFFALFSFFFFVAHTSFWDHRFCSEEHPIKSPSGSLLVTLENDFILLLLKKNSIGYRGTEFQTNGTSKISFHCPQASTVSGEKSAISEYYFSIDTFQILCVFSIIKVKMLFIWDKTFLYWNS